MVTLFPHLTVWLLLQAWPDPVFEGDILTLWCHGKKNVTLSYMNCYKDGKVLHFSMDNQPLFMGTATMRSGGQYSCTGEVMYFPQMDRQASGTAMVQVQGESPAGGIGESKVLLWDLVSRGQQLSGEHPSLCLPLMVGQSTVP